MKTPSKLNIDDASRVLALQGFELTHNETTRINGGWVTTYKVEGWGVSNVMTAGEVTELVAEYSNSAPMMG